MGISDMKNSKYCDRILIFSAFVLGMPVTFYFTSMNPLIPVIRELFNSKCAERNGDFLLSLVLSFPLLGALVGASTSKYIVGYFGPKKSQIGLHLINIFANVITISLIGGLTWSCEVIIFGRMMAGFVAGLSLNLGVMVMSEICARNRQPFFQSILGVALSLGGLLGPFLGYSKVLGTIYLWPVLVSMTSVPSVIWLCASSFITESPFFLLRKGRKEEATRIMRKLRLGSTKELIEEEISLIENELFGNATSRSDQSSTSENVSLLGMFRTKQHRRIFVAAIISYLNLMLTGVNNIVLFSDQIFLNAGIPDYAVTPATIGVFIAQFIVALFGSKFIEKFGAKKVNIGGAIVMIAGHLLITVSLATLRNVPNMRYLSIVGMVVFMLGFSGGPNVATFPIVYAVTTQSTRTTCITYGGVAIWLSSFLVAFLPPHLQPVLGPYIMVPWLIFCIVFMLYMIYFIPDIHTKTSEEIQDFMKRK